MNRVPQPAPPTNPVDPQLLTVHVFSQRFWVGKKKCIQVLSAEFQTLTRQGLDHLPCTTPSVLCSSSHFMPSIQPSSLMGLLINSWSCDGCVHRYVSEC